MLDRSRMSLELTLRVAHSIAEVTAAAWDACANPGAPYNPFVSHAFLSALESSSSVGGRAGWQPMHLLTSDSQGILQGAVPCYVKSHSQGEYVFDHGWADAYERAGGSYYPKLQVSVPFTPVTGRRLLTPPGAGSRQRKQYLAAGLMELARRTGASSAHVTFLPEEDWSMLGEIGF